MAKFHQTENLKISLFPMIDFLVCTLGILIFILTTITIISLGIGKSITIIPEVNFKSNTIHKTPTYFEWNGYELILHPIKYKISFGINIQNIETYWKTYAYIDKKIKSTPFEAELNRILANIKRRYIIVLIRPSGFNNFIKIRGYIESKGIDIGYEPIEQDVRLRVR